MTEKEQAAGETNKSQYTGLQQTNKIAIATKRKLRPYHEPVHELLKRINHPKIVGLNKQKVVKGRNLLSKDLMFSHCIPAALETFNQSGSTSGEYGYRHFGQKHS